MKEILAKDAFSKLKPELVTFVLSTDGNQPNGQIVARFMKVSRNPPLVAISVSKQSNTNRLIKTSKEFVIATANQKLLPHVDVFGSKSGKNVNKFDKTKIETTKAKHLVTPLLKNATINFECKLEKEIDAGNSTLFVGKILAAHINENEKTLCNFGKGHGEYIFKEL